jgi:ribonuclease HI
MQAYRELERARDAMDRVQWERTKIHDGRTGQDILEQLDKVLSELHPPQKT